MSINEKDRLDLRRALERVLEDERLASIAMEAMPPISYDTLATHQDVALLRAEVEMTGRELRGEMAELRSELRGEMAELRGELKAEMAGNLRIMIAGQVATMALLGAWVTAVV